VRSVAELCCRSCVALVLESDKFDVWRRGPDNETYACKRCMNTLHTRRMLTRPGLSSETWCFTNLRFDCSRALAVPSEAVAAPSRARRRRFVELGPHITANAERRGRLADLGHGDVVWNGPTGFAV